MGLDMFVYRTKKDIPSVDFSTPEDCVVDYSIGFDAYRRKNEEIQVWYWRKHPNLHGWMKKLYETKGGESSEGFNGDNVRLDKEDIENLKVDILAEKLPHTEGFFFGTSYGDETEVKNDLEFIEKAINELSLGYKLFYTSSW